MKHTAKYVPLDEVIYNYISQAELTSAHYLRIFHLAIRGLKELGINVSGEPVTRKLNVLPNKTVELPVGYVNWIKVGVLNNRGEVATLRHNPNLSLYASKDNDRLSVNTDATQVVLPDDQNIYRNYYSGNDYFHFFGVPAGLTQIGEFRVDDPAGLIILDNNFRSPYIILEYLECPVANSDYKIPVSIVEALIAWIAWKDIEMKPASRRSNIGMVEQRRRSFFREKRLIRSKDEPFRIQDFNEVLRLSNRGSIKS